MVSVCKIDLYRASYRSRKERKVENVQGGLQFMAHRAVRIACFYGFRHCYRGRCLLLVLGP